MAKLITAMQDSMNETMGGLLSNLGIKSKVVILAVLPVSIIATWLSYIEISTRFETLDTSLNMRADTIARNLARASEVAIVSGNQELLDQLSLSTLLEEDVLAVSITTHNKFMGASAQQSKNTHFSDDDVGINLSGNSHFPKRTFLQPILLDPNRGLEAEDTSLLFQSDPILETNNIGNVELHISTKAIELAKREALFTTILATLLAVMLTIAIGLLIGRAITRPIVELSDAVKRIEEGDHNIALRSESSGEIKTLQSGFMSMANTIRSSQQSLINEVEHATSELRNTLKTVEKQNTALESARQKEHEANQAKSEFLANISHEIRTPMNAVIGFADILKETNLDEQQAEYISTIKKSGEHLVSIINDILDLSRIEAGKLNINPVDFNLRECLEDVIQLLAPQAHDNSNELVMLVYNDVPDMIHADPLRIKQIVLNLIHNALKFTQSGSVILRVMDEGHDGENISLGINVEDTGIGIDKEDIENLFTAYNVSQHNPQRRSGGTGLGLSITHKLVESMDGHIGVESTVNEGTTFHCHVKVKVTKRKISEANFHKPLLEKSVVLFDNHHVTRLAITHMLNRAGAKSVTALEFSELSQEKFDKNNVKHDIAIISLPRHEDYEVDKLLRILSQAKIATLCILAPGIEKPALENFKNHGIDIVINRPVREDNLISSLASSLDTTLKVAYTSPKISTANKYHALVADDHDVNLRVVSNLLSRKGYEFTLAKNGAEAIELATQKRFDLIFMDIHMPEINGIEATQVIRQNKCNKETPIIALTADAISLSLRELLDTGFNDRLVKPIVMQDLVYQLDRWCNQDNEIFNDISEDKKEDHSSLRTELRAMLLKELPGNLQQLSSYRKDNNADGIYELAHRLHSASCYCDWPLLKQASSELEASILNNAETEKIESDTERLSKTINDLVSENA